MRWINISYLFIFLFCSACKNTKSEKESGLDILKMPDPTAAGVHDSLKYLLPILDSVLLDDQRYRTSMTKSAKNKNRKDFLEFEKKIQQLDEKNLKIVTRIIGKHGWLGYRDIGLKASMTLFMVIQHADLRTQEKYLPVIREAFQNKNMLPSQFAMLVDRVELKNKRPQVYGTQILSNSKGYSELQPLLNPDSVDSWRRSIGMDSLKNYLRGWKIEWDVEKYKRKLPELRKKYNIKSHNEV